MADPRTRFVSRSAVTGAYHADARRAWLLLIEKARTVARPVVEGRRPDRMEAAALAGLVTRHKAGFPPAWPAAQAAATAFAALLKAFVLNDWSPWLAGFVLAGADALDAMLVADAHAHAEADRRRIGEVD
ncbi:hypothetical protein [Phenylobacterium sp.]|uniref:hypothetical protein n=1 Tax=Phenylobacterium sp. TaxID=1871053 RepID=UPI003929579D